MAFVPAVGLVASAHALYRSSSPANGADLEHAPSKVVITFSERADPKLSVIEVLDSAGRNFAKGHVGPVQGRPLELSIRVGSLSDGVYTVTWRAVATDDGHTTAGSFSFGVNAKPSPLPPGGSAVKSP